MPPSAQFPEIPKDPRRAAAWMDEEPLAMAHIWKLWGEMDIYFTLAKDVRWKTIDWSHPSLDLTNIYDLAIPETTAIQSTLGLKKHSLFTGPNRGGKSSTLRAILQQILLGQTFGFTFGETTHGAWTPFKYIFTRLKSRDSSGKESLFEMEVRMASTILKTLRKQSSHTLVLIDELFHSTNPPDAETSARLFLQQLWTFPQAKSIISTHIFSLCESCPTDIETFCCSAIEHDDTSIEYSYMLSKGVCRVSSVREVLAEHEILRLNTS
jgi:DNA mismatch repair ATPase MutS